MKERDDNMSFTVNERGILLNDGFRMHCHITEAVLTVDDLKSQIPEGLTVSERSRFIKNNLYLDSKNFLYCKREGLRLVACSDCGELIHPHDSHTEIEGKVLCNGCFNDYAHCSGCGRWVVDNALTGNWWLVGDRDGRRNHRFLCNECTDYGNFDPRTTRGHYVQCYMCGDIVRREDGVENGGGAYMCSRCNHHLNGDCIHSYHYRSDPGYGMAFLGIETRTFNPLMGVELEVDKGGENTEKAMTIRRVIGQDKVVICHDGSLNNGFEIISCPASLKHHLNSLRWKEGMLKALELGYRSHDGGSCGLHVHIDRKYFETQDMEEVEAKFFISFRNNLEWLKVFSRRFSYAYCAINGYEGSEDGSMDTLGKITYPPEKVWVSKKKQNHDRHSALNFKPEDTIEIRIFRGTLNYKTFIATLQFVQMWAKFVKNTSYESICNLRLQNFLRAAERERYQEFIDYLRERNIIEEPNGGNTGF